MRRAWVLALLVGLLLVSAASCVSPQPTTAASPVAGAPAGGPAPLAAAAGGPRTGTGAGAAPALAPAPSSDASVAPAAADPARPTGPGPYVGHGLASIPPELLAKYRPTPLDPDVASHVETMMDVRAPGAGRLSPDGKTLYFSWSVTGVPQIWKIDGPRRFPAELTGGEDATSLAAITPDGKWLVVQRDREGEENPGLYLQRPTGGPLVLVRHQKHVQTHFEQVSHDGAFVYFTANDVKPASYAIYRFDIARDLTQRIFDEDGLWHVSDLRDDGRLLLRKETGELWAEYYELDPAKGALTPLFGQGEHEEYDARYGARDGEIVVLTNKFGDYRRLYAFAAGRFAPLGADVRFDVSGFDIDRYRTRIVYTTNEGGYTRPHALDARTRGPLPLPTLPAADHIAFGPTTPDGRYTTLAVDDGRHPPQGYVIDWRAARIEAWHSPSAPEIDTTHFARAEAEAYPARDGTAIPVFVRQPARCARELCPVVVAFHGGPEGQARPGFNVGAQMFVDFGFVYVEPNVRGSDGYGKRWLRADDGPKRLSIITDIEDASRWARVRFAVDGKEPKVGIYGGSYGGYSVLMGMTMFAGAYDAGVDVVGISDLRTFLRNTAPYRRVLRVAEYGDPEKDGAALEKLSPMSYVDRARAPLLIAQGANDPRVPAGEAVQIHDALERRGVPCPLMIYPDEGHGAVKRENRALMIGHAIAFFRKELGGR